MENSRRSVRWQKGRRTHRFTSVGTCGSHKRDFALTVSLCLTALACSPSLAVPDGSVVTCRDDRDCPRGLAVCAQTGLCVSQDLLNVDGPTLLRVTPSAPTTVVLEYDVPLLEDSVRDLASYTVADLTVRTAALRDDTVSVLLETSEQIPARSYTLLAAGVRDIAGRAAADPRAEFRGFGLSPDELAPDQVTPPDNAQIVGLAVTLSWSGRAAASSYTVDVALDADFLTPAQDPIVVDAPATSVNIVLSRDGTYYWRVRSDVQSSDASSGVRAIHLFQDTIYVSCPADVADCSGGFGTREQPLYALGAALSLAENTGVSNVLVAGRPSPYLESLLVRTPVTIECGYDTAFGASLPSEHPTTITSVNALGALFVTRSPSVTVRNCSLTDGLGSAAVTVVGSTNVTFENVEISEVALDDVSVVSILDAGVTFRDSTLRFYLPSGPLGGRTDANGTAILQSMRSSISIVRSQLVGVAGLNLNGIVVVGGSAMLEGSRVTTGDNAASFQIGAATGISVQRASLSVSNSSVFVGRGFSGSTCIRAFEDSTLVLERSVVASTSSPSTGSGIRLEGPRARGRIVNSVISPATGGFGAALSADGEEAAVDVYHSLLLGTPGSEDPVVFIRCPNCATSCMPYNYTLVNNILVSGGNTSPAFPNLCQIGPGDEDLSYRGTLLLHNALVTTAPATSISAFDLGFVSPSQMGCGDSTGNVFVSRTRAELLPNLAGPDGDPLTLADNDYRPANPLDRAALRVGADTSGNCAMQPCVPVGEDIAGEGRTTEPPSCGPYDLP